MRIAIVGAGAIGTLIGHAFCRAGYRVTVIDLAPRLAQLEALGGLAVIAPDGGRSIGVPERAATVLGSAADHDVVFLATKSQDLPAVAGATAQAMGPETCVVTLQNGIPWWYFQRLHHAFAGRRLSSVDPDGTLERFIDASRIVGCVAYPAASVLPDGTVQHVEGVRFPLGELDGEERERTRRLAALFAGAGFKSRVLTDIRSEIWLKALGALSLNPISALTRATMAEICTFGPTRALVAEMMREAKEIADSLGVSFRHTIEERIEGARAVGHHKTSMLQDVESGRTMELDALLLAVLELAELTGRRAEAIRHVYACAALLNRQLAGTRH